MCSEYFGFAASSKVSCCLQDPIKSIHFSNSNPVCHAFDQDAKDGHDLLIGLFSGDGKRTLTDI
jgi:hypothetical protein